MDFNFSYDIYPHPPMFCNNEKSNKMNKNIYDRNNLCPEHKVQVETRSGLTKCTKYNDDNNLPSSCNYLDINNKSVYAENTGYYKHYFNNIDVESKLLLAKPALPQCKIHSNNMNSCVKEYGKINIDSDNCFLTKNSKIWNNSTKRKIMNNKKI